jgi:ribosome-associated translation inhibitor RaiA
VEDEVDDRAGIVIRFEEAPEDEEELRLLLERRCARLREEFPETTHVEVAFVLDGGGHAASARVTGRATEVAAHATGDALRDAADRLFERLERQLRRVHDKRIFSRRREARRDRERER